MEHIDLGASMAQLDIRAERQHEMEPINLGRLLLKRPLVAFHLETTGFGKQDRIIEIAAVRVQQEPDGTSETVFHSLVHPGCPMRPEVTAINGIKDKHLKDAPKFAELAIKIWRFFEGADFLGYNALGFHVRMLAEEFAEMAWPTQFPPAAARVIDPLVLYMRHSSATGYKQPAAYQHFCSAKFIGRPTALEKAKAALQILVGQLHCEPALPETVSALHDMCESRCFVWRDGQAFLTLRKHRGAALSDVAALDRSYLQVFIMKGDFPKKDKLITRRALKGVFTYPPKET